MLQLSENANEQEVIDFLKNVLTRNPELFKSFTSADRSIDVFMQTLRTGEPTFVLRAQDETAVAIITHWLSRNQQLSKERKEHIHARIVEMIHWSKKKLAD